jgi:hypothetical protein
VGQQVGVPFPGDAGQREGPLADRARGNGVDLAAPDRVDRAHDRLVRGPPARGVLHTQADVVERRRAENHGFADLEHPWIDPRFPGDLGSDPGGVTDSDTDADAAHGLSITQKGAAESGDVLSW